MIIEKFQQQVEAFPDKIAIKAGNRTINYSELNTYANQVAHAITAGDRDRDKTGNNTYAGVSLLFEHGADMIIGVMSVLKAGKIYVPLDVAYPSKRLLYMLENSESYLILTNESNLEVATQLAARAQVQIDILNIDTIVNQKTENTLAAPSLKVNPDSPAYILYTSGSTGRPKGVVQTQRNIMYYTRNWIQRFSITEADRMTLFSAFSHDGSVQDMFAALLAGATIYPYNIKTTDSTNPLYTLLMKEKITIWHSVPTLFRYFCNTLTEKNVFYDIRWVLLGGEPLRPNDLELFRAHFPNATLANVYGQTESSVSTICTISQTDLSDAVCLGDPLDETEILLVGEDGDVIETMGLGEIVVACDYIAPGYWRDEESSKKIFTHDDELGRLYWTGDLGRLTMDGLIKVMGRKDSQTKIRGFRVETGEIESVLLQHESVKEVVAMAKEDENIENYLCVYFVSDQIITPGEFREYLSRELPDYMIPRYFISLDQMPLTPNGKIHRRLLPEPEERMMAELVYVAPTNEIENKLAAIWQEVMAVEKVGINDNFIELGGHSLLVISILSKIHQEFQVELQLRDVFDNPTVKELSRVIMRSEESIFSSIQPTEDKEYYSATPEQKRMYVLNHFEGIATTYNITLINQIGGKPDRQRFEKSLQKLVERHEAFQTSFRLIEGGLVQVIHKAVDFQMSYITAGTGNLKEKNSIKQIINDFIRPFDLGKPPLLRASLIKMAEDKHLWLLDIHHIISDGLSQTILSNEFVRFYGGEELPGLKLRYRDYSEWHNHLLSPRQLKQQEEYWINLFKGDIPVLNLPLDFPRPALQSFEGDVVGFILGKEMTRQLNQLAKETSTTLYMVLLAMFNVLMHKYSNQEDIIIGSIIAGRKHVNLENIIGFFAKTLATRNNPAPNKSFVDFLQEVKTNTLNVFENQTYPFTQLVEKLGLAKDRSRNPLFDVVFVLEMMGMTLPGKSSQNIELNAAPQGYEFKTSMFDLSFEAMEKGSEILCGFQYCTKLFKRETIELMRDRFLILVGNILDNPQAKIQDLDYADPIEKEMRQIEEVEFDL
jgi:amino acid adenylation domain-containing protein